MRQVPQYLLIGDGRVARHFFHYFDLLKLNVRQWSRRNDPELHHLPDNIKAATHILVLISDRNIETFIQANPALQNKIVIHCSGNLVTSLAFGAHPLMTFAEALYEMEDYQQIPFVLDEDAPSFDILFPGLSNSHHRIPKALKSYYHSLCVMSGNFMCLLWQKFFSELENTFTIPKSVALPYLKQVTHNLVNNPDSALTGPLIRKDHTTIAANLNGLANDDFRHIYQAFVQVYSEEK